MLVAPVVRPNRIKKLLGLAAVLAALVLAAVLLVFDSGSQPPPPEPASTSTSVPAPPTTSVVPPPTTPPARSTRATPASAREIAVKRQEAQGRRRRRLSRPRLSRELRHRDPDRGVFLRGAQHVAVLRRNLDEMRDLFRCGRLEESVTGRPISLKNRPKSGGRDDEVDRRLVCDIAVRVQDIPGYAHVVAGLRIAPLQAAFFLDQHLLRAGEARKSSALHRRGGATGRRNRQG